MARNIIDFDGLLPALDEFARRDFSTALKKGGLLLETSVKAHASGRPGPRAPNGDYRRSWNTRVVNSGTNPVVIVGTNAPQGRRLEFGDTYKDTYQNRKLGRVGAQWMYPHVEPALQESQQKVAAVIMAEIVKVF